MYGNLLVVGQFDGQKPDASRCGCGVGSINQGGGYSPNAWLYFKRATKKAYTVSR